MTTSDVLAVWGIVVGVLGLIVTFIGFYIAVQQLKKTTDAAQATTLAITSANSRMLYNHLLTLLPQLSSLEVEIDTAILKDDREGAVRALVQFSLAANTTAALLTSHDGGDTADLVDKLQLTAREASKQKNAIVSGSTKALSAILGKLATDVSEVSGRCAGLAATYKAKVA
jgi:hypothetical protein